VWALGVILYRCLTGSLPFVGDSVLETLDRIKTGQMRPLREACPGVPAELEAICLACLRKEPGERPTAAGLAERLERFVGGEEKPSPERERGVASPAAHAPGSDSTLAYSPRRSSRRIGLAALAVVVLAAVLGLGWWLSRPPDQTSTSPDAAGKPQLRITAFRIRQFMVEGKWRNPAGIISRDAPEEGENAIGTLPFEARVRTEVEFSEPGYAYLIAFNADGKAQLRWPVDVNLMPDENVSPPPVQQLCDPHQDRRDPDGANYLFNLDDEPRGGLQAFAVVLSREPLPSYAEWVKGRALPWRREAEWKGAWLADAVGVYPVLAGRGVVRGRDEARKVPPLLRLVKALRSGDVVVEVLAVPVEAKEKQP
jgi:hypothetical protein